MVCGAISSQPRHVSTIGKKLVKRQYLPHMSSQYDELRPTSSWDPSKFQPVSVSLLHRRRSTEVNQTLHDVWPSHALVHYIYFFPGLVRSCPITAKFTLRPSLALFYIDIVTARHSSSVSQTLRRGTRNGITEISLPVILNTLSIGAHSGLFCVLHSITIWLSILR